MTEIIREQLGLTWEDMALYLHISPHMVKSIEMGRRQLPMGCQDAVLALLSIVIEDKTPTAKATIPLAITSQQMRRVKSHHRKLSRRLRKYVGQLEKMKQLYADTHARLDIYHRFTVSLAPEHSDTADRLKWTKWRMAEENMHIEENNPAAQAMLALEIAALESRVAGLAALMAGSPPGWSGI